jgi:DNA-binding protein YbaB
MSQIINESYLYEGLDRDSARTMQLWENAGRKIVEANLDAATIQKIFTAAEQGAVAGGDNRTLLGLGKDAATAVKAAYDDLAKKIQDSGPVKDIDAKYDQAAEKLKAATGGDQGVMKYVQKYRDFAKAHPIAQSLIYSALIAAAGISGAGLGGAAALGLLKMTDKLLQGEKFSTAVGKGLQTGVLAYGASKLGDLVKNTFNPSTQVHEVTWEGSGISHATIKGNKVIGDIMINNQVIKPGDQAYAEAAKAVLTQATNDGMLGTGKEMGAAAMAKLTKNFESIDLTDPQLAEMFATVTVAMVNEGLWDAVKKTAGQAAGAVVNKAQQVGSNLTNKVTADKLNKAWVSAGSPADSEQVKQVLITAGVPENVVADVFKKYEVKRIGAPEAKAAIDQMIKTISSIKGKSRTQVAAYALQQLTALDKLSTKESTEFYSKFLNQKL